MPAYLPVPDDAGHRRRVIIAVAAGIGAVIIVALAAYVLFARPAPPSTPRVPDSVIEPASSAEASETSGAPSTEPTSTSAETSEAAEAPRVRRAPVVAFRRGSSLFVADEDGKRARSVVASIAGEFTLSPNGRSIAVAQSDASGKAIVLVDVSSKRIRTAGTGVSADLSWSPDSSILVYTAVRGDAYEMRKVFADGHGDARIGPGVRPKVSPDGSSVAYSQGAVGYENAPLVIASLDANAAQSTLVAGSERATDWAWLPDGRLLFVKTDEFGADPSVYAFDPAARASAVIGTAPVEEGPATLASLHPSPDGRSVLLAYVGDDGHSRMLVIAPSDPSPDMLSSRRDVYPYEWTVNGKRIMYFEGNRFQGEPSTLMSARPDGTDRRVVIEDASGASP